MRHGQLSRRLNFKGALISYREMLARVTSIGWDFIASPSEH